MNVEILNCDSPVWKISLDATERIIIFRVFEDSRASPRAPFSCENVNNKKERLGFLSMTWILRVGATGFEPAT